MKDMRPYALLAALGLLGGLSACGGGGGASAPVPNAGQPITQNPPASNVTTASKLGVTFAPSGGGTLPFASARRTASSASVSGTPVTVTYNGQTVATGTLDSKGFAELTFTSAVPAGATVTVTAGTGSSAVTVTLVLATAVGATAANVVYNPGPPPTVTVITAADQNDDGVVSSNDGQQTTETENPGDGQPEDVNNNNAPDLPSNLPITISVCKDSTITVAPSANAPSGLSMQFEEKVHDDDSGANFEYTANPFTAPITFPVTADSARVDIEVFSNGQKLVSIEAPIGLLQGATGGSTGSPSPSSCPTISPIIGASPMPSASPSSMPSATPSSTPSASPSSTPSATPSSTPSATPSSTPAASPSPSATP